MAPLELTQLADVAAQAVKSAAGETALHEQIVDRGEVTLVIEKTALLPIVNALRSDPQLAMDFLSDVTAIDYLELGRVPRFDVVYHLYSLKYFHRIRLRAPVGETPEECRIDSLCGLWKGASFMERETYDLMGIVFDGHPDLRRILMPDNWEGHPLRKDHPLGGATSFYYKQDTDEYAGEPSDLIPRIRVQDGDV